MKKYIIIALLSLTVMVGCGHKSKPKPMWVQYFWCDCPNDSIKKALMDTLGIKIKDTITVGDPMPGILDDNGRLGIGGRMVIDTDLSHGFIIVDSTRNGDFSRAIRPHKVTVDTLTVSGMPYLVGKGTTNGRMNPKPKPTDWDTVPGVKSRDILLPDTGMLYYPTQGHYDRITILILVKKDTAEILDTTIKFIRIGKYLYKLDSNSIIKIK